MDKTLCVCVCTPSGTVEALTFRYVRVVCVHPQIHRLFTCIQYYYMANIHAHIRIDSMNCVVVRQAS